MSSSFFLFFFLNYFFSFFFQSSLSQNLYQGYDDQSVIHFGSLPRLSACTDPEGGDRGGRIPSWKIINAYRFLRNTGADLLDNGSNCLSREVCTSVKYVND